MGNSAPVMSRDTTASVCRICLSSTRDEPEPAGDAHARPADEVQCIADAEGDGCHGFRVQFLMENEVISPCDCAGTQQHVHLHCLLRWIAPQPSRATKCEVCNAKYQGRAADVLGDPAMQGFFRIHRTLFACCTTNNRYDRAHAAALTAQMKEKLICCMHAGGVILQTTSRAAASDQPDQLSREGSTASQLLQSQLLQLLLASRRAHWNSSAFLIVFSRPRAASDGSTALIAVNITQQLKLHECPAALQFQRMHGVRCAVYRGGPCKSNTPIAVLSHEAAGACSMLFNNAAALYHPNLVHTWRSAQPPCCFYRCRLSRCFCTAQLTPHAAASFATLRRS
jgi:hypothetical protein